MAGGKKKPENEKLGKVDGLTLQEHTFCAAYVANGGNATDAARVAFPTYAAPHAKGSELLMRSEVRLALEYHLIPVREAIANLAPMALQSMKELASCRNEKVRYLASRDLLDRAGHREPERKERVITIRLESDWRPDGNQVIDVTPIQPALPALPLDIVGGRKHDEPDFE